MSVTRQTLPAERRGADPALPLVLLVLFGIGTLAWISAVGAFEVLDPKDGWFFMSRTEHLLLAAILLGVPALAVLFAAFVLAALNQGKRSAV